MNKRSDITGLTGLKPQCGGCIDRCACMANQAMGI